MIRLYFYRMICFGPRQKFRNDENPWPCWLKVDGPIDQPIGSVCEPIGSVCVPSSADGGGSDRPRPHIAS